MVFSVFFVEQLPQRHACGDHSHSFFEVVLVDGSSGYTFIDGKRLDYRDHDCILHTARSVHRTYNARACRHLCLGMDGADTADLAGGVFPSSAEIRSLFAGIIREMQAKRPFFKSIIEAKCTELFFHLRRLSGSAFYESPASKVKTIIESRYREKLDLTVLANEIMMSKDYIRHAFKERYHTSPMQYLIARRIEHAKKMLAQTDAKIQDIAVRSGFENEYYFSRLFKKVVDATPSEYRRREYRITEHPVRQP